MISIHALFLKQNAGHFGNSQGERPGLIENGDVNLAELFDGCSALTAGSTAKA
jgi:hypothetical protein